MALPSPIPPRGLEEHRDSGAAPAPHAAVRKSAQSQRAAEVYTEVRVVFV